MIEIYNECVFLESLINILYSEEKWIKVHSAEFLLSTNTACGDVFNEFKNQELLFNNEEEYRIGIWRVLYKVSSKRSEKQKYLLKILEAFFSGIDKIHALETLSKLKVAVSNYSSSFREEILNMKEHNNYYIYGLWNLYFTNDIDRYVVLNRLFNVLMDHQQLTVNKILVSYIFRFIDVPKEFYNKLLLIDYKTWQPNLKLQYISTLLTLGEIDQNNSLLIKDLLKLQNENNYLETAILAISTTRGENINQLMKQYYKVLSDKNSANYNADFHATADYAMIKFLK
ncbi:hypothetical protein M3B46_03965 [Sphingobacterium daejeonense]|uniref:hypothetical protein n=2 Tax=Sphingobacterium daejeonense TaxID=371142 RepID=UPI0021A46378|nr:hypothetical protein [Sphingobacterium daejeonense]MCT1530133.1 hypothetical protein [Sphingobacterium daejeonense]